MVPVYLLSRADCPFQQCSWPMMVMEHVPKALGVGVNASLSCLLPFTALQREPKELKRGADRAIVRDLWCITHQLQTAGFGSPCHKTSVLDTQHNAVPITQSAICFVSKWKLINCCHYCEKVPLCSRHCESRVYLIWNGRFCGVSVETTPVNPESFIMLVFSRMQK